MTKSKLVLALRASLYSTALGNLVRDVASNPTCPKHRVMLHLGQDPRYGFCQLCGSKCAFWYLVSIKLQGSDWFMNLLILRANNLSLQIFCGVASLFLWFHSYLPPRAQTSTHGFWELCSMWWLCGYLSLLLPSRQLRSDILNLTF